MASVLSPVTLVYDPATHLYTLHEDDLGALTEWLLEWRSGRGRVSDAASNRWRSERRAEKMARRTAGQSAQAQ